MNEITFETRIEPEHLVHVPEKFPIGTRVRVMIEPLDDPATDVAAPPVSVLGQRLAAIRRRAIERGMVLKSADEILAEVHEGRAEAADDQDVR